MKKCSSDLQLPIIVLLIFLGSGCAYNVKAVPKELSEPVEPTQNKQSLFVFFDGTSNKKSSNTNVYKLFKHVKADEKPDTHAIWIEGVGATSRYITGNAFGGGMESRINTGYRFLSKHYNDGDDIYIIGFSRGAHQARALAGLVSYAGLLATPPKNKDQYNSFAHTIIEFVKEVEDIDYEGYWQDWRPGSMPPLSNDLQNEHGFVLEPARIKFLGLWDTVPGSSFKDFNTGDSGIEFTDPDHPYLGCKEDKDGKPGDRYKIDSYPVIQNIAHAVAIEEKRSMFRIVLVCKPLKNQYTTVEQIWFPGAHSDVGGGYAVDDLSKFPLFWMLDQLTQDNPEKNYKGYKFLTPFPPEKLDPLAASHFSFGDFPGNFRSDCVSRPLPRERSLYSAEHWKRLDAKSLKVRISKKYGYKTAFVAKPYPIKCSDVE